MPMPDAIADLSQLSLTEIAALAEARRLPPVHSWTPTREGESGMRIARDGRWYHQGGEITRPNMMRLFSTVLRREACGRHALVTPVEKLWIDVEDAPFQAVEVKSEGEGRARSLAFRLNSGDLVVADAAHSLTFDADGGTLLVRDGLLARIGRAPWYDIAEWMLAEGSDPPGLWSGGVFFAAAA